MLLLTALVSWRIHRIVDWIRAAWILRKLHRPAGLYDGAPLSGVRRLLTGKRLRVMQKLNSEVVAGSGVFYYNILWGHVRVIYAASPSSTLSWTYRNANCSAELAVS